MNTFVAMAVGSPTVLRPGMAVSMVDGTRATAADMSSPLHFVGLMTDHLRTRRSERAYSDHTMRVARDGMPCPQFYDCVIESAWAVRGEQSTGVYTPLHERLSDRLLRQRLEAENGRRNETRQGEKHG